MSDETELPGTVDELVTRIERSKAAFDAALANLVEAQLAVPLTGVLDRGVQQLTIAVVPDSGTGALVGLAGPMRLEIADGVHAYDLAYTLPVDG